MLRNAVTILPPVSPPELAGSIVDETRLSCLSRSVSFTGVVLGMLDTPDTKLVTIWHIIQVMGRRNGPSRRQAAGQQAYSLQLRVASGAPG